MLGGFSEEQIQPGLYAMSATGSYLLFSSAQATWRKRANQLCGVDQYKELNVMATHDSTSGTVVAIQPGVFVPVSSSRTSLNGYILCNSSPIGKDEAERYIASIPELRKKEMEERVRTDLRSMGGPDCNVASDKDSAESYLQRSKLLRLQGEYTSALVCLKKAVSYGQASTSYKDACFAIGEMYELGLGLPANISIAKEWYAKAGLP